MRIHVEVTEPPLTLTDLQGRPTDRPLTDHEAVSIAAWWCRRAGLQAPFSFLATGRSVDTEQLKAAIISETPFTVGTYLPLLLDLYAWAVVQTAYLTGREIAERRQPYPVGEYVTRARLGEGDGPSIGGQLT